MSLRRRYKNNAFGSPQTDHSSRAHIAENLSNASHLLPAEDILNALRQAGVYDPVFELPDNLSALVSPNDDRFKDDALMRLGLARAILRKPSVAVVQEP